MVRLAVLLAMIAGLSAGGVRAEVTLLNVSYDGTRELYAELNQLFIERQAQAGRPVRVQQSHGGSGKQARAVIEGLQADVVTLALGYDVLAIERAGLISAGWERRAPHNASPFASTVVLLVRKGNPKNVRDWGDLARDDVALITPNPQTSGGARWIFLGAWAYAAGVKGVDIGPVAQTAPEVERDLLTSVRAREFVRKLYRNVLLMDTGARGSVVTFAQKRMGDVLLAWENEALLAREEYPEQAFEVVYPSVTMLAEPSVAIVDAVADARGTRADAEAYVAYLYSREAQEVAADHFFRPRDREVAQKHADTLPAVKVVTIGQFGGWGEAQRVFFGESGVFSEISRR